MIEMNKPMAVKIHDVNVDQEYVQWIAESLVEKFKLLKTKKNKTPPDWWRNRNSFPLGICLRALETPCGDSGQV